MRVTTWVALAVLLLAAGMTWAADEPTYKGQPASYWVRMLADTDDATRLDAIGALVSIGDRIDSKPVVEKVAPLLDDKSAFIRGKACRWLAKFADNPLVRGKVVGVATRMTGDDNLPSEPRTDAALALADIGADAKNALPVIEKSLALARQWDSTTGEKLETTDSPGGRRVRALLAARDAIRKALEQQAATEHGADHRPTPRQGS